MSDRARFEVSFDPWDLDPRVGPVQYLFEGHVIGATRQGHWILELDLPIILGEYRARYVALTQRYVGQAPISSSNAEFPYTSGVVFLTEEQALNPIMDRTTLQTLPGLRGVVRKL